MKITEANLRKAVRSVLMEQEEEGGLAPEELQNITRLLLNPDVSVSRQGAEMASTLGAEEDVIKFLDRDENQRALKQLGKMWFIGWAQGEELPSLIEKIRAAHPDDFNAAVGPRATFAAFEGLEDPDPVKWFNIAVSIGKRAGGRILYGLMQKGFEFPDDINRKMIDIIQNNIEDVNSTLFIPGEGDGGWTDSYASGETFSQYGAGRAARAARRAKK